MTHQREEPVRGFFFWSLSPFLIAFIVLMPMLIQKRNPAALVTLSAIEFLAILALLGLVHPIRFWWAWRGVGALVFLGYAAYLVAMLMENGAKLAIAPRKAEPSAFNAPEGTQPSTPTTSNKQAQNPPKRREVPMRPSLLS
jgi:hypothetical protein